MKKLFILLISSCLLFIGCKEKTKTEQEASTVTKHDSGQSTTRNTDTASGQKNKTQTANEQDSAQIISTSRDSILLKLTQDILTAIRDKNYLAVANYIDPISGIRFSPYAYVDTVDDVILSKKKFTEQAGKTKQDRIVWGVEDATEESINMTLNEYVQKFVYDVDFAKPEKCRVNKFIKTGNSLNNLLSIYKNCDFTESHFSGFEKKFDGLDWRSLRLVFKKRNGKFMLIGIVHDQWTI